MVASKHFLAFARDIGRLTRHLHVSTRPGAKIVDTARIGPFGAMVLMTIQDFEPLQIQHLAKHLGRDKAQMTRAVQMLEKHELILRSDTTEDGRISLVSLSDKGHNLASAFQKLLAEQLLELFASIDEEEQRQFSDTLRKVLVGRENTP